MIDALLYAVRDAIRGGGFGYDHKTCEIMADGHPKPQMGAVFVAVHQADSSSVMDNALKEYFDFNITLTMRVVVPLDRVGDQLLAIKLARKAGPGGTKGFNARAEQLRAFLHMNWAVIGEANSLMVQWEVDANIVNGFAEPMRFRGMGVPNLVGGEWLQSELDSEDVALMAELSFKDACRQQPEAEYV